MERELWPPLYRALREVGQDFRQKYVHYPPWVLAAVFLYSLTVETGQFEIVKQSVAGLSADRRIQALLIAFSFGAFIEGAAGFGTPVAITAALLMGLGMLFGSLLALAIALTRVALPYDEQFVGLSRAELVAINDRLLPFMAHDRVTLAGTMVTLGVLYTGLSLFGIRAGLGWARVAVLASAAAGFASFFLFLGFGYFDPFHAFVTAVLFQFVLLGLMGRLGTPAPPRPDLREDRAWRLSQWGQLVFVVHGVALVSALDGAQRVVGQDHRRADLPSRGRGGQPAHPEMGVDRVRGPAVGLPMANQPGTELLHVRQ